MDLRNIGGRPVCPRFDRPRILPHMAKYCTISGMEWKSNSLATWACFVVAVLALALSVIWRIHDKGGTVLAPDSWKGVSVFAPAVFVALLMVVAAIINYRAHQSPKPAVQRESKPGPKLVVYSALYGIGDGSDIQIVDKLNAEPKEGLVLAVNNNLVNRDPAPGKFKHLAVNYSYEAGPVQTVTIPEFGWLFLPGDPQIQKLQSQIEVGESNLRQLQQKLEEAERKTVGSGNRVFVFVSVISLRVDEKTVSRGKTLKIRYTVSSSEDISGNIWLGASFQDHKRKKSIYNVHQDKPISLLKGTHEYDRDLTIPADVSLGSHMLGAGLWQGVLGDSTKSISIARVLSK